MSERVAKRNALDDYYCIYMSRAYEEGNPDQYFSAKCAPGEELDEQLRDSTWASHY